MDINLKALIGRFTPEGTAILQATAGYCVTRSHNEVTIEHFLLKCLDHQKSDIPCILTGFEIPLDQLRQGLQQSLEALRQDSTSRPAFSSQLVELLQQAWLLGSIEYGSSRLRTGYLLLALISRPFIFGHDRWTDVLRPLRRDILFDQFREITAASTERDKPEDAPSESGDAAQAGSGGEGEGFIAQFCVDFTEKARQGKIDPVFGRDVEIRQIVDILARRRKNNPILVADPESEKQPWWKVWPFGWRTAMCRNHCRKSGYFPLIWGLLKPEPESRASSSGVCAALSRQSRIRPIQSFFS